MTEGVSIADLFGAADKFLLGVLHVYGGWVYAALFGIFFAETGVVVLAFLPGDSLVFVAGALAAGGGLDLPLVILAMSAGAIVGNTTNFAIGSWLGHRIYDGTLRWIDRNALMRTHAFFERHGGKTIVAARFVPVVRTFAPLVAGAAEMSMRRFQVFSVAGALLWIVSLSVAGYLFGNVPWVKDHLGIVLLVGLAAALGPVLLGAAIQLLRRGRA